MNPKYRRYNASVKGKARSRRRELTPRRLEYRAQPERMECHRELDRLWRLRARAGVYTGGPRLRDHLQDDANFREYLKNGWV